MAKRIELSHDLNPKIKFKSLIACVLLSAILSLVITKEAIASKNAWAEWCQCAIFVVNHLGLEIIPGDYYTAGSLAEVDESGRTWMEYQGFSRRSPMALPRRGDVVVIQPYGRVFSPLAEEGSELIEVKAAWTGHIGVVESADREVVAGKDYWRLTFLSSNWGVNASPMFVRSNCFNVDRSIVWMEPDDPDFSFWQASDPDMQRRHILNIGRQLANGYYHIGIDGKIDGYPISGDGLIAFMWNIELNPDKTIDESLSEMSVEVPQASIQPGDALILSDGQEKLFQGVYTGSDGGDGWYENGLIYWFDPAAAVLRGPLAIDGLISESQANSIRVYRSVSVVPEYVIDGFEVKVCEGGSATAAYTIRNDGGQTLKIEAASVRMSNPQGSILDMEAVNPAERIEIPPGQEFVFFSEINPAKNGVYIIRPFIKENGITKPFPEMAEVRYLAGEKKRRGISAAPNDDYFGSLRIYNV